MENDRIEQAEKRKRQDFERKKESMRTQKKNKMTSHKKIVARSIAKQYLRDSRQNAYRYLGDVGAFTDRFQTEVLEQNVLPWMFNLVEDFISDKKNINGYFDTFVNDHVSQSKEQHDQVVDAEYARIEQLKKGSEEAEQQRLAEKQHRREARAAAKKARELQQLREEIDANFVTKGESKEAILYQELS